MFVGSLILGVALGLLRGGRLQRLAELKVRLLPLFLVAIVLRVAAALAGEPTVARPIYVAALWLLTAVGAVNYRLPGMDVAIAGLAANAIVVSLNGGAMPVLVPSATYFGYSIKDPLHVPIGDHTLLPFLGDIVALPLLGVYSTGDILLAVGVFLLTFRTIKPAR